MIGFVSCPVLHNTQQWSRRNNIATKTIFRAHKIITTVLGHKRRAAPRSNHPPTYVPIYLPTYTPAVRPPLGRGNDAKAEKADETVSRCMRTRRKVADLGYSRMGRARKNKTHRNAAAQTLAGHLSPSLARSPSFPSSVHNTNTHKHICARMCVCVCVCVCVFVCGVRPPLFARARLHFSAAYLLHDVFIQSTSPLGSRSRTRHTRTHTQARAVSRPPSLRVQKTTQAAAAAECSTNVLCELATYTHTHTHTHIR
jgi:hypothetical protein